MFDYVLFIGGSNAIAGFVGSIEGSEIVAKFKRLEWSRLPNLRQGRSSHASIRIGSQTFILGGSLSDGKR